MLQWESPPQIIMVSLDWTKLFKKHGGKWIALMSDGQTVVGSGNSLKAARKAAIENGCSHPYLMRMPKTLRHFIGSTGRCSFPISRPKTGPIALCLTCHVRHECCHLPPHNLACRESASHVGAFSGILTAFPSSPFACPPPRFSPRSGPN